MALRQRRQKVKIKDRISAHSDNSFEGLEKQNISKQYIIGYNEIFV